MRGWESFGVRTEGKRKDVCWNSCYFASFRQSTQPERIKGLFMQSSADQMHCPIHVITEIT